MYGWLPTGVLEAFTTEFPEGAEVILFWGSPYGAAWPEREAVRDQFPGGMPPGLILGYDIGVEKFEDPSAQLNAGPAEEQDAATVEE